ncbi:MAG: chemotaxis protein MotB [Nitrospirae bacterium]|nr:MAG: chemotaxis protein MotB [Nitrospirota bacterium]
MNICTVTRVIISAGICSALLTGCVSTETHKKTLAELEQARKALESSKKQAAAEADRLQKQLVDVNSRVTELMSGSTTAQEEIARLQKRASELEAETASANELVKQLSEQDQDLKERLKTEAADKARLEQERAAQDELLKAEAADKARLEQERAAQDERLKTEATEKARLEQERAVQDERLKTEGAEKARLEQDRAAKEEEIQRLTKTHEELTKSLQAEIAKGDIKIKQVRDRLTINMVDRVLFDSGKSKVKPSGLKVLKQVSDILKKVTDKQIRIEGHTDNVPIGTKLKDRFQSNWELSTARATSVVRYLIEEGGVDRANLTAVGYADTKPIASNDTEEGRTANRRIEIALYPKDLSEIANQLQP